VLRQKAFGGCIQGEVLPIPDARHQLDRQQVG
jgi:hypothetical protein